MNNYWNGQTRFTLPPYYWFTVQLNPELGLLFFGYNVITGFYYWAVECRDSMTANRDPRIGRWFSSLRRHQTTHKQGYTPLSHLLHPVGFD